MFDLDLTQPAPLSVATLLVNLCLGAFLASLLAWHYERYGRSYSNRTELAWVFPLIVLAVILVISVVKTSLALSLGLIGALSIVRFRTPIKEPEELAYLFIAIAIGLGLGADQRVPTLAAFGLILSLMTLRSLVRQAPKRHNLYMNIEVPSMNGGSDGAFQTINEVLAGHVHVSDMRRLDVRDGSLQATYYIDCQDSEKLVQLLEGLKRVIPGVGVSFVEQKGIPAR
jgi:uncharacterized membrane protein YhiD involved in acid resistance